MCGSDLLNFLKEDIGSAPERWVTAVHGDSMRRQDEWHCDVADWVYVSIRTCIGANPAERQTEKQWKN